MYTYMRIFYHNLDIVNFYSFLCFTSLFYFTPFVEQRFTVYANSQILSCCRESEIRQSAVVGHSNVERSEIRFERWIGSRDPGMGREYSAAGTVFKIHVIT